MCLRTQYSRHQCVDYARAMYYAPAIFILTHLFLKKNALKT